jgi:hypothetical protein
VRPMHVSKGTGRSTSCHYLGRSEGQTLGGFGQELGGPSGTASLFTDDAQRREPGPKKDGRPSVRKPPEVIVGATEAIPAAVIRFALKRGRNEAVTRVAKRKDVQGGARKLGGRSIRFRPEGTWAGPRMVQYAACFVCVFSGRPALVTHGSDLGSLRVTWDRILNASHFL